MTKYLPLLLLLPTVLMADPPKPTVTGTIVRMGVASYLEQRFWEIDKPRGYVALGQKGKDTFDCICLMARDAVPEGTKVGDKVTIEGDKERIVKTSGIRLIDGCYINRE